MFFGEYNHQVDAKNRIRIPAKLKAELTDGYVFMKGSSKCVSIYPAKKLEEILQEFTNISPFDTEGQESLAEVLSSVFPADEDGQGRIVIPEALREYAGITKDVVTIGMMNHIDIYSKEERENIKNKMSYQDRVKLLQGKVK